MAPPGKLSANPPTNTTDDPPPHHASTGLPVLASSSYAIHRKMDGIQWHKNGDIKTAISNCMTINSFIRKGRIEGRWLGMRGNREGGRCPLNHTRQATGNTELCCRATKRHNSHCKCEWALSVPIIAVECGTPKRIVHHILTKDLQMRKVCENGAKRHDRTAEGTAFVEVPRIA